MFTRRELTDAIGELEKSAPTLQNCEKLSTLYTIYDHLFRDNGLQIEKVEQETVYIDGESDFCKALNGKPAEKVWAVICELADAVRVLQPSLFAATVEKINSI